MRIDHPTLHQIPALRQLWQEAFGDEDAFLDIFFSTAFSSDRCLCLWQEDTLAGALYWFDCSCRDQKFAYLYAVATAVPFRGRGICGKLMVHTHRLLAQRGYAGVILVPQSEPLRAMYRHMGYRDCTSVTEFTAPTELPEATLRHLTEAEYGTLRRELLPADGMVQEGENLRFLGSQAVLFGGNGWIAAVTPMGEKLHCHELLGDPDAAYGIVSALGCREGFFRIPGSDTPFAQYLPLAEHCPAPKYFGLAFD